MTRRIPTIAALILAAVFAAPAIRHWRERPPAPPPLPQPLRGSWLPAEGVTVGAGGDYAFGLSLAPDGRQLVYPAAKAGVVALWLHDLRSGDTRELPGTGGAAAPFWSPDGSRIGFFAGGRVRALDLASGIASDLAEAPAGRGAAWNAAGDLVFSASANAGVMRRAADGSIAPLTTVDPSKSESAHTWPSFLPDGRHVIFLVSATDRSRAGIWILPVDNPASRRRLLAADAQAIVVASDQASSPKSQAHTLLFLSDLALMSQPLDATTLEPVGRPALAGLPAGRGAAGQTFATAAADVLIYGAPGTMLRELRWVSRTGEAIGRASEPVEAWDVRVAPDGRRVAVTEIDPQLRTLDVFIRSGSQPVATRLSPSTDVDESGVWSPDGLRIAWAGQRQRVLIRGAGAVLPEQAIATFDSPVQIWDWSRDGRTLLIGRKSAGNGDDLWLQPPTEGAAATPYATAQFNQAYGVFSPDGRSIAYASDESGKFDIYVDMYPKPGARVRVTTAGGTEPRWKPAVASAKAGRELYFRRGSEIHAVKLDGVEVRSSERLFDAGVAIRSYDVAPDGRFLINLPASNAAQSPVTIVTNWKP